ncbi:unnamed protein product [Caenorhabditis bovis]|uniref:CG-1 domain-containing protein n=1 Tax=Caenorhabditis bovis TaxID=2654633 RepID=A0A8S1EXH4_9PELO|nr:unnamed protein product [Caenorhabditis bovis]
MLSEGRRVERSVKPSNCVIENKEEWRKRRRGDRGEDSIGNEKMRPNRNRVVWGRRQDDRERNEISVRNHEEEITIYYATSNRIPLHSGQSFDCGPMQQHIVIDSNEQQHLQQQQSQPQPINIGRHAYFETIKNKWNSNQEIADILCSVQVQWVSSHMIQRPASGTQLIFPRYDGTWFKNDEYIWRRRREGKLVREDHMKLKIHKQQVISANYVHSAIVPTFHRRVYWLTHNPGYVLVHYLNESNADAGIRQTADKIAECMTSNNVHISIHQLTDQLIPIYAHCLKAEEVQLLANNVAEILHVRNTNQLARQQQTQQNSAIEPNREYHLERRNSCSSAFRRGLSSIALRRQPSANSEIDANYIGTMMKKFGCGNSPVAPVCACGPSTSSGIGATSSGTGPESLSPSGETDARSSNMDEDLSIYRQPSVKSSLNGNSNSSMYIDRGAVSSSPMSNSNNNNNTPSNVMKTSMNTPSTSTTVPIAALSPSSSGLEGGGTILVVGGWYMKGHEYQLAFGKKRVPAKLVQAGVLSAIIPEFSKAETVKIQVYCNDKIVSSPHDFSYVEEIDKEEAIKRHNEDLQALFERIRIIAYALNAYHIIENLSTFSCNESSLCNIIRQIEQHFVSTNNPMIHHQLITGNAQMHTKNVLHIAAALDFDRVFEAIFSLSRHFDYCREFDVVARDVEGCTPLHIAARHSSCRVARFIIGANPSSVDVLDDRGRTPSELANGDEIAATIMANIEKQEDEERDRHVNATELWVMTNGETVTREHLLLSKLSKTAIEEKETKNADAKSNCSMMSEIVGASHAAQFRGNSRDIEDDCDSCFIDSEDVNRSQLHVEISMDTDVHVPDSPKMARLFRVVTSPGVVVSDIARAKMADLARQIIEALPERIKRQTEVSSLFEDDDSGMSSHHLAFTSQNNPMLSQNNMCCDSMDSSCNVVDQLYDMMDERSFASTSTRANTFECDCLDFDKDLGEFFTINVDKSIDPIQQRLANLKFNDDEQRDVYEAAMVIQRAYREYRARNTSRRQEDIERRAALKIQGCYRRYKQFCYFKKLHNAAIVVQKHFRMRKNNDKEENGMCGSVSNVPEHPTLDGQSIRIQVPQNNSSLLREHRAATTIQLAYRGHRKRQAAARKIQNFMRQSRNKLRKMHAQNDDATFCVPQQPQQLQSVQVQQQPPQQQQQQPISQIHQQLSHNEISTHLSMGICQAMAGSSSQTQATPKLSNNFDRTRTINGESNRWHISELMIRRLGEATFYRAESPSQTSLVSYRHSEVSLPSVDYSQQDNISCNTLFAEPWPESVESRKHVKKLEADPSQRIVTRDEIAETESNLCKKLSLIVDLTSDFTTDATKLYESADELLKELRTKIRIYIYYLDVEMADVEKLLRFNVDRSSICDDRIDWLLHYTKCHKEMRRILTELSEDVCEDLENSLELRAKGIIGKKPSQSTITILSNMREGMQKASRLLGCVPRQRA